jgi:histone H3/H4
MESYKENDKYLRLLILRYLPIANIGRIMKKPLHENAKIAKEAKEIVQICVSEFISFVTSEGNIICKRTLYYYFF